MVPSGMSIKADTLLAMAKGFYSNLIVTINVRYFDFTIRGAERNFMEG